MKNLDSYINMKNRYQLPNNINRFKRWILALLVIAICSLPSVAQVATLTAWTNLYHGTSSSQQTVSFTVPTGTGSNRLMVVAVAASRTTSGAVTGSFTYGGRTLTAVGGDFTSTGINQHTAFYYIKESDLDLASNSNLVFTVSGGTIRVTDVWATVLDFVNQTTPITDNKNANNSANTTSITFSTNLTVNSNDLALLVTSLFRSGNATPRTLTAPTNYTKIDEQTFTTTDGVRNVVSNRTIPSTNTSDASTSTASGNCWPSQTGISVKGCTAPVANAGSALAAICKGGTSAALGGSVSGSATTGTWSDGGVGGSFSPNATTLNATYTPPSTYTGTVTLTLTAPSSSCGSSTASKTLNVNAPASATISYPSASICSSITTVQNATIIGTTGGTFSASPAGLSINATTGAITASSSTIGNYTVTYTISGNGCSTFTTTTNVTILQTPTINVSGNLTACNSTTLSASGGSDYLWSGGNATTSAINTFSSSGTYTLTITASNGCTSTNSYNIVINPIPTNLNIASTLDSVCSSTSQFNLTATSTSNSSLATNVFTENFNGATNNWTRTNSSTGGTPANAAWTLRASSYNDGNETFVTSDASQFYLSNSDAQGSGSTTNTILRSPSFSTSGLASASINLNHYYRYNSGTDDRAFVEASTNNTTWTTLATYSSTQGTASAFATATISLTAGFLNQPTVYIRLRYTASWDWYWAINSIAVNGNYSSAPPSTYSWTSNPSGFSSSVANPTNISQSAMTTYNVIATNSYGCTSTVNKTIKNYSIGPKLSISDTTLCSPAEIMIGVNDSLLFPSGYPAGTTVEWLGYGISGPVGSTMISTNSGSTFQAQITIPSLGCTANSNTITVNTKTIVMVPTITPSSCGLNNGKIKVISNNNPLCLKSAIPHSIMVFWYSGRLAAFVSGAMLTKK